MRGVRRKGARTAHVHRAAAAEVVLVTDVVFHEEHGREDARDGEFADDALDLAQLPAVNDGLDALRRGMEAVANVRCQSHALSLKSGRT